MVENIAAAEPLAPELEIALSYTPRSLRDRLRAFLTLDRRLAQIVGQTREPMLGQMRLVWWRDTLAKPASQRPTGDAVLDIVSAHWAGDEAALIALIHGWEAMLAEPPLTPSNADLFAKGRAEAFAALDPNSHNRQAADAIRKAARRWALVDAALHIADGGEREMMFDQAGGQGRGPKLPNSHRGLAILDALAIRSLAHGNRALMHGRGAAIIALKVGLLGR